MRVELLMSVLGGAAGGLCGTLWGALLSAPPASGTEGGAAERWNGSVAIFLRGAVLYAGCGALLGLLFWLGWGLAALAGLPWPLLGLSFAALAYGGGAAPVLGLLYLRLKVPPRAVGAVALEWLVACLAIGQLCALAWHRAS